jgi:catechol 2,3-dioxygenase-like lactoylglutathione lyase family enzyme
MTTTATRASLATAMFSVRDQDAAVAFYTGRLGWEVRSDVRFGPDGENRWVEVAPAGSVARLAVNPPMEGEAGGGSIGIEVADVRAEHARLTALGDVDVDAELMEMPGVPVMFSLRDPDGNAVWVVGAP